MTVTTVTAVTRAPSAPAVADTKQRLYFADHMRVALISLVIVHHLAIALAITLPGLWYFEAPTPATRWRSSSGSC